MKRSEHIDEKLAGLPDKPGVYMMRDARGRIIYIGKAASLRKRVQSYFRHGALRKADPKLRGLINSIADFDYLVTRTEAEAMLTESRFIKDFRPYYNVLLKDDKHFLLIKLNRDDPFPVFKAARIRKEDGATYFGPYVNSAAVRAVIEFMEKRFGLRQCRPRVPGPDNYAHCMNDIIRYCSAPCIEKISREDYHHQVDEAIALLSGERPAYLKEVRAAMQEAATQLQFEKAAALRDTLGMLHEVIKQRARIAKTPELREQEALAGIIELQAQLALPDRLHVIEAFDISNISGTHAVASMVCSVDGMPRRNRYRLFRIKTVTGPDDPGMMNEVIHRRYSRLVNEQAALPDLVLVDGGITQVRAARRALAAIGLPHLPVAGLAKQYEEIIRDDQGAPRSLLLPRESPALKVLQHLRDEAHRFALTYHRKLRARRIRESSLDEIPGIGKKRKQQLLAHFGSVTRLKRATIEDIAQVPGFGKEMATLIQQALHPAVTI
ncbi:MAG: excinuclease ABC subunit UvrC [Spartobacteria bacterium]|nr:excinuclease ABC subunit UvrC [Spartobacteria bacterium]